MSNHVSGKTLRKKLGHLVEHTQKVIEMNEESKQLE